MQVRQPISSVRRRLGLHVVALLGLTALLFVPGSFVRAAAVDATVSADAEPKIVEHAISGKPLNIVVEEAGKVWVTLPAENQIGRLTVDEQGDSQFDTFTVETTASKPYDLVLAGNSLWFTEMDGNKIARLNTTSGVIDEFAVPTAGSMPAGIDVAPNGMVWFVQQAGDKLARLNPTDGTVSEFPVPAQLEGGALEDVSVRSNTQIWFTAPDADAVGIFNANTGSFTIRGTQTPTESYEDPLAIIMDPANDPWVSSFGSGALGRYTPETLGFWKWFPAPSEDAQIADVSIRDIGNRWLVFYTQTNTNQVGLLTVRESDVKVLHETETPLLTANSRPWGVAVDDAGHAWIAESDANVIAEWRPPYYESVYLPYVLNR